MTSVAIVGQGLAGSLLAWGFMKRGIVPTIYDPYAPNTSSRIAAGVINPLIGKRKLQLSWNAERLAPFAFQTFQHLQEELGVEIIRLLPTLRVFATQELREQWQGMQSGKDLAWLTVDDVPPGSYNGIDVPFGGYLLHDAAVVDFGAVIDGVRAMVRRHGTVHEREYDGNAGYERVIWCEGWTMSRNERWNWIPMEPVKGEVVDVRIDGMSAEQIVVGECAIVPMNDGSFRLGSTYDWDDLTEVPTASARDALLYQCGKVVPYDVHVLGHRAAVRPAARSKRPYLGVHPLHPEHVVFNGLGTKGGLVGPYYSQHLIEHLLDRTPIDSEVDIQQWWTE